MEQVIAFWIILIASMKCVIHKISYQKLYNSIRGFLSMYQVTNSGSRNDWEKEEDRS